jgi:hypothetical protein
MSQAGLENLFSEKTSFSKQPNQPEERKRTERAEFTPITDPIARKRESASPRK